MAILKIPYVTEIKDGFLPKPNFKIESNTIENITVYPTFIIIEAKEEFKDKQTINLPLDKNKDFIKNKLLDNPHVAKWRSQLLPIVD